MNVTPYFNLSSVSCSGSRDSSLDAYIISLFTVFSWLCKMRSTLACIEKGYSHVSSAFEAHLLERAQPFTITPDSSYSWVVIWVNRWCDELHNDMTKSYKSNLVHTCLSFVVYTIISFFALYVCAHETVKRDYEIHELFLKLNDPYGEKLLLILSRRYLNPEIIFIMQI